MILDMTLLKPLFMVEGPSEMVDALGYLGGIKTIVITCDGLVGLDIVAR